MRQDKDRGSKWLLTHHGDSVLRLGGIDGFTAWRAIANEKVAPRRLPDGLLEVQFPDREEPVWILVEIESHADSSTDQQVFEDLLVIALEHGVVPEVLSIILKQRGSKSAAGTMERVSIRGGTRLTGSWPVVKLWELDAEALLAAGDAGLIPWVPLTKSDLKPEELMIRCRDRIESTSEGSDREVLKLVTEILAGHAFPGLSFRHLFGEPKMFVESPFLDEVMAELGKKLKAEFSEQLEANNRDYIVEVLETRFGTVPVELRSKLQQVDDADRLKGLLREAVTCPDVSAFMAQL